MRWILSIILFIIVWFFYDQCCRCFWTGFLDTFCLKKPQRNPQNDNHNNNETSQNRINPAFEESDLPPSYEEIEMNEEKPPTYNDVFKLTAKTF